MSLGDEIVLRPRFRMQLKRNSEWALQAFEAAGKSNANFVITRIDDRVFIKIPKEKQHFWSPQLDLQIWDQEDENTTMLRGLFGPKPTVWTLFMFLHFVVAGILIAFGIWAYSNATLGLPYAVQVLAIGLSAIAWFVLYFAGRLGKSAGRKEMIAQYKFMREVLQL
ncbi:MAG: GTP-binding protein [Bacteroidota bacterium]